MSDALPKTPERANPNLRACELIEMMLTTGSRHAKEFIREGKVPDVLLYLTSCMMLDALNDDLLAEVRGRKALAHCGQMIAYLEFVCSNTPPSRETCGTEYGDIARRLLELADEYTRVEDSADIDRSYIASLMLMETPREQEG